jgi:hypothetical protein
MAYAPVTISAGVIDDGDLNTNLSRMRKYTNGEVLDSDYDTDWVSHRQLMAGRYNGVTGTMNLLSGIQGGKVRTAPRELVTFFTRYNTCRNEGGGLTLQDSQFNFIPNTMVVVSVPRQLSTMLVHFHIESVHEDDSINTVVSGDGTSFGSIRLVMWNQTLDVNAINNGLDGANTVKKEFLPIATVEEDRRLITNGGQTSTSEAYVMKRFPKMGTFLKDNVAAGSWRIALVGKTNGAKVKFIHWSISVEGWL